MDDRNQQGDSLIGPVIGWCAVSLLLWLAGWAICTIVQRFWF